MWAVSQLQVQGSVSAALIHTNHRSLNEAIRNHQQQQQLFKFPRSLFGTRIWTQPNPTQVPMKDEDRVSDQFVNSPANQPDQKDMCKLA